MNWSDEGCDGVYQSPCVSRNFKQLIAGQEHQQRLRRLHYISSKLFYNFKIFSIQYVTPANPAKINNDVEMEINTLNMVTMIFLSPLYINMAKWVLKGANRYIKLIRKSNRTDNKLTVLLPVTFEKIRLIMIIPGVIAPNTILQNTERLSYNDSLSSTAK